MINETAIASHLAAINEAFAGVTDELPARLERIKSFCGTAVHSVERPTDDTATAISARIDKERDRLIDGGFEWNGHRFQSRPSDRENIMGAAQLAMAFIGAGGDAETLRWADPDKDFVWITADNTIVPMSPADVIDLFQTGVAFKSALTFYARSLKDAVLEAEDPTVIDINSGWPV